MKQSAQSVRAKPVLQMDSIRDNATTSRLTAAATALVVDSRLTETRPIVALLTAEGFEVTVAESFHRAKDRLTARPPNLLVTEIRLGEYNGLHLVLRGKAVGRRMAALVMSSVADPVLQSEAEAMGATFLVKPIDDRQFLAAVARTLFQRDQAEGPVRMPFERRLSDRRASSETVRPDHRQNERRRELAERLQQDSQT